MKHYIIVGDGINTFCSENELEHYGVKGMKWGVRKAYSNITTSAKKTIKRNQVNDANRREKMDKISKNKYAHQSDRTYAKYGAKTNKQKVISSVVSVATAQVVNDVINGKAAQYKNRSSAEWVSEFGKLAKNVAVDVTYKESLARSVASRYNDDGKRSDGKKATPSYKLTKEDKIAAATSFAQVAYPFASAIAGKKYFDAKRDRQANEAKFNSWNGRILESKFNDIITLNRDRDGVWR